MFYLYHLIFHKLFLTFQLLHQVVLKNQDQMHYIVLPYLYITCMQIRLMMISF